MTEDYAKTVAEELVQAGAQAIGAMYGETQPGQQMQTEAAVAVAAAFREMATDARVQDAVYLGQLAAAIESR